MAWLRNLDIGEKLGVEKIYGLIDKEIKERFGTKKPTFEKIDSEDIIAPIIMHRKTPEAINFRTALRFKHHDLIMTKEHSVSTKIMKAFAIEQMKPQYFVLVYRPDLHFLEHKLAVDIEEKEHKDRNINDEIERQKAIEKELGSDPRINLDKENILIWILKLVKYAITLKNQMKN